VGDDFDAEAWLADQALLVERLAGQVVSGWCGVEMAIRETAETGPQFGDHEVGSVQLVYLVASLKTDAVASFTTYQDDDLFGLRIGDSDPISGHHWAGIYRARHLTELPTGTVEDIRLHAEEGVHDELLLTIAGARLLLIAGEIYENNDSSLGWHRFDESVLAFTNIAAADRVAWIPARTSTATRLR
jgi:hypothetical protein